MLKKLLSTFGATSILPELKPSHSTTDKTELPGLEHQINSVPEVDVSGAFTPAVTAQQDYQPTVPELLAMLKDALQDTETVSEMWPNAAIKDIEMFKHLRFEFDLEGNKITAETAAKDSKGEPAYQHIYDGSTKQATEIAKTENIAEVPETVTVTPVVAPVAPEVVAPAAPEVVAPAAPEVVVPTVAELVVPSAVEKKVGVVAEIASEEVTVRKPDPKLTHDQMMEINIKVAFFFIATMIAGIVIAYIYHRMVMSRRSKEHRTSFCAFLAGKSAESYPHHPCEVITAF